MTRYVKVVVCLIATLFAEAAFAQVASPQAYPTIQVASSRSPVAYVYVGSNPSGGAIEIEAFAAASDGKLTPVTGSPFQGDVESMAVNGQYLFGVGTNGVDIESFSIATDGALQQVASINAQQFNGGTCGGPGPLFLDHTGGTLYDLDFDGNTCSNNTYQSFSIDNATGELNYLGSDGASTWFYIPLSFIGNNVFAYGAVCLSDMYWQIYGFQRNSDGMLTYANITAPPPTPKKGDFYCPFLATADATNHVAMSLQAVGAGFNPDGLPQLATFTADSSGNLTTKSTHANMPRTVVKNITDICMSPSGKLLAVGGTAGLQVFHFNGSEPITRYTGLLTKDQIDQFFWDNDNHLYAISRSAGKLFVFSITPKSAIQAPGSPYAITSPQDIIVLPKT